MANVMSRDREKRLIEMGKKVTENPKKGYLRTT